MKPSVWRHRCFAALATWFVAFPGAAKPAKKPPALATTLPPATPGGARVFIKYSLQYYPTATTRFDHLVLFPDGTAFDDIPTKPLPNFSAARLRALLDPRVVGKWTMVGNRLSLAFPNAKRTLLKHPRGWFDGTGAPAKDMAYDIYYPVISPLPKRMLGAWKNNSLVVLGTQGGGAPMVAGSSGLWQFNANGTFSDGSQSFTSATTANMGEAFKGEGNLYSLGKDRRASSGKWRIDGPLLTLEKAGQRTVHLAFLMPYWTKNMTNTDLLIDGDRWKRPDTK